MAGEVLSVIRALAGEGLTMLIVTHEMKFVWDVSSRIFYMDQGGNIPDKFHLMGDRKSTRLNSSHH